LVQLTSRQFSEWQAYDKLDPIGTWRDDFRFAILESLILNIVNSLYSKKGHTPKKVSPMDFMLNWDGGLKGGDEGQKKQSTEDMKRILLGIAKAQNRRVRVSNTPPTRRVRKTRKG
jgi:hypothetical protein